MTDLKRFKKTLLDMKCDFASVATLVGHTVSVYSETGEMQFEFDRDEQFSRTI